MHQEGRIDSSSCNSSTSGMKSFRSSSSFWKKTSATTPRGTIGSWTAGVSSYRMSSGYAAMPCCRYTTVRHQSWPFTDSIRDRELNFAMQAIRKCANNECAWNYLSAFLGDGDGKAILPRNASGNVDQHSTDLWFFCLVY